METFLIRVLIKIIQVYQATFGGLRNLFGWQSYCCHEPSCSLYMIRCLEAFGLWKGVGRGLIRIVSCHPFSRGGWDPVPGSETQ